MWGGCEQQQNLPPKKKEKKERFLLSSLYQSSSSGGGGRGFRIGSGGGFGLFIRILPSDFLGNFGLASKGLSGVCSAGGRYRLVFTPKFSKYSSVQVESYRARPPGCL